MFLILTFILWQITDINIPNLTSKVVADKRRVHVIAADVSFKIEAQLKQVIHKDKTIDLESLSVLVTQTKIGLVVKPFRNTKDRPSIQVMHCVSSVGDFVPDFGKKIHYKMAFTWVFS